MAMWRGTKVWTRLAAVLLGISWIGGCREKPEAPSAAAPRPEERAAAAPADTAPQPAAPRADAAGGAAAVDREAADAALDAAGKYLNSGELPKAKAILARLIDKAPNDLQARELMGQVLTLEATQAEERGDEDEAEEARLEAYDHYRVAVDLDPGSAGLRHSAGMMAMMTGDGETALEHFRKAAALDPANPQYPLYAAQVLIARGDLDAAAADLDRVLALDPDEPQAHASLAMIALEQDRFDEALQRIGEARTLAPEDIRFRALEAKIHRRHGDPRRSVELLIGLPDVARRDLSVGTELALAYSDLDEHDDAAQAWADVFGARRDRADAYVYAANAGTEFLRGGRMDMASRWLLRAKTLKWNAPEVRTFESEYEKALAQEPGAVPGK